MSQQVTVASTTIESFDRQLKSAIIEGFRQYGTKVAVEVGQGVNINGIPVGTFSVDRT